MNIVEFLTLVFVFKSTAALLFNGNSTWRDFQKCKEFDVSDGYNYREFFRIDAFTKKAASEVSNDTIINIEIAVLAVRDAHILLSSSASPTNETPVYEIVIGAGSNTFSEIRRFKKLKPLKTKSTQNILSVIRPIPINIVYKRAFGDKGQLEIYTNGEPFPLLSYNDPTLVDVKYISFCSWGSAEAKWFYDCEPKDDSNTNSLTPEPKNLTALQQLREKFWTMSQFHVDEPETETEVKINFEIKQMDYDIQNYLLTIRGLIKLDWHDIRNVWDPEEFGNISMYRGFVPIWYPYLSLVNGKTKDTELDTGFSYAINNKGSVEAITKPIEIITWCLAEHRIYSWPNDDHFCYIRFGTHNKFVKFIFPVESNISYQNVGKWLITSIFYGRNYQIYPFLHFDVDNTADYVDYPETLEVTVAFQRNKNFHGKLFFTPLVASFILVAFSFWTHHPHRCSMSVLAIVIQIVVSLMMSQFTPYDYVPTIVRYYHFGLYFSCISLIFMMISLWFAKHPPENPPHLWILDIIDSPVLRTLLALGVLGTNDEDINGRQLPWIELTKIFDRIIFILIVVFFLIMLHHGY